MQYYLCFQKARYKHLWERLFPDILSSSCWKVLAGEPLLGKRDIFKQQFCVQKENLSSLTKTFFYSHGPGGIFVV